MSSERSLGSERGGHNERVLGSYALVALLALLAYFYGLGNLYIPKNGDEAVYFHITRLTAQSGQWLPLASELDQMRNTKPPLLFWQGLISSDWARDWSLWQLRLPSVLYTLGCAGLIYALAARLGNSVQTGLIAALAWLSFFCTYRYGRPFLTNPPEIFWLFLPFFALTYWGRAAFESRVLLPLLMGLVVGIGLLYKSFALMLPVGFGLTLWYWHYRQFRIAAFLRHDTLKLAITTSVALVMFALWFVFDPDPHAVWKEFVIGENAQKFDAEGGYLRTLFWGGSSVWSLALQYPLNAALLAVPVVCVFVLGWRNRRQMSQQEQRLWLWIGALFLVFVLPSQRSGRYLMPAMPALAVLLALYWPRIGRFAFVLSLLLSAIVGIVLLGLTWQLSNAVSGPSLYPLVHWLLMLLTFVVIIAAIARQRWLRPGSLAAIFLVYLCFASSVSPLAGPRGQYSMAAQRAVQNQDVWVPCNFRASHEPQRFVLPGANVLGYSDTGEATPEQLASRYARFAVRVPIDAPVCESCTLIGERLEIRSRHTPEQIRQMLRGRLFENLFVREWLIESKRVQSASNTVSAGTVSQCR